MAPVRVPYERRWVKRGGNSVVRQRPAPRQPHERAAQATSWLFPRFQLPIRAEITRMASTSRARAAGDQYGQCLLHLVGTAIARRRLPGVLSAPLLLVIALWLLYAATRPDHLVSFNPRRKYEPGSPAACHHLIFNAGGDRQASSAPRHRGLPLDRRDWLAGSARATGSRSRCTGSIRYAAARAPRCAHRCATSR